MRRKALNELLRYFRELEEDEGITIESVATETVMLPDGGYQIRVDCEIERHEK